MLNHTFNGFPTSTVHLLYYPNIFILQLDNPKFFLNVVI